MIRDYPLRFITFPWVSPNFTTIDLISADNKLFKEQNSNQNILSQEKAN